MAVRQPALIELRGVSRVFAGSRGVETEALSNVSLRIGPGEFVGITGPSGSGKSTLMNILGCLDRPTAGTYRFAGRDVGRLGPDALARLRREAFGFVFQSYNLLGSATAQENVELPASYAGVGRTRRADRARELLVAFGMGERVVHRPAALSGGEQQRVAIARALMNGGQVILADEPTGALDSRNGEEVLALLSDLSRTGHTVVVITHDPDVAAWTERRIELEDGRVTADSGTAQGLESEVVHARRPVGASTATAQLPGLLEAAQSGLASLRANLLRTSRLRTLLTVLSVAVGVWLVVAMLSVVQGGYRDSIGTVARTGADLVRIMQPGRMSSRELEPVRLDLADVEAIDEQVTNVRAALPVLTRSVDVRYGDRQIKASVHGTTADIPVTEQWPLARGVFLSERDSDDLESVAVVGADLIDTLFAARANPLGEHVLIGDIPFLVKGVLTRWGARFRGSADPRDRYAYVPFATAQALLFGNSSLNGIDVYVDDPTRLSETADAVRDLLIRRHGRPGFVVWADVESRVGFSRIDKLLSALIGLVAAVSLFLGAMGVTSVMLVSVSERTREIGIRMATGARRRDILRQFLLEATAITATGGVLGALFSGATSPALAAAGLPVDFSGWFLVAGIACAVGTGLIAGIVPARQAAGLDPVRALAR